MHNMYINSIYPFFFSFCGLKSAPVEVLEALRVHLHHLLLTEARGLLLHGLLQAAVPRRGEGAEPLGAAAAHGERLWPAETQQGPRNKEFDISNQLRNYMKLSYKSFMCFIYDKHLMVALSISLFSSVVDFQAPPEARRSHRR